MGDERREAVIASTTGTSGWREELGFGKSFVVVLLFRLEINGVCFSRGLARPGGTCWAVRT